VQRERKKAGLTYRAFEILNLGKYERQHFIAVNPKVAVKVVDIFGSDTMTIVDVALKRV
jgi:hypothetical protein